MFLQDVTVTISKDFIRNNRLFGEKSVGYVKDDENGKAGYFIGDTCVLLSEDLRKLNDPILRIMYNGVNYGTGAFEVFAECEGTELPQEIYQF